MSKMPSVPDGQVIEPSGSPARGRGGLVGARLRAGAARFAEVFFGGAARFFVAAGFVLVGARFFVAARGFAFARFTLEARPRAYAYSMSPFSMT